MNLTTTPPDYRFAAMYDQHGGPLRSFVTRLALGDSHTAEDVVQETFVRAWQHTGSGAGEPPGQAWLFTVARRNFIDRLRRQAARPAESSDAGVLECIPEADRIDAVLDSIVIADALKALSPIHRDVIHEVFIRGRKIDEAARAFDIPSGTVKSRLYYGVRALRSALQERDVISAP